MNESKINITVSSNISLYSLVVTGPLVVGGVCALIAAFDIHAHPNWVARTMKLLFIILPLFVICVAWWGTTGKQTVQIEVAKGTVSRRWHTLFPVWRRTYRFSDFHGVSIRPVTVRLKVSEVENYLVELVCQQGPNAVVAQCDTKTQAEALVDKISQASKGEIQLLG